MTKSSLTFASLVVFIAGCPGAMEQVVEQPVPVPVLVPITVGVASMDLLRAACWYMPDSSITRGMQVMDQSWRDGITLQRGSELVHDTCLVESAPVTPVDCAVCWDTLANFIYLVWH